MIDVKKYKSSEENSRGVYKFIWISLLVIALVTLIMRFFSEYYNFLEISEVGGNYNNIFWKNIAVKYILQGISLLSFFLISMFSLLFARMNMRNTSINCGIFMQKRNVFLVSILVSAFFSSVLGENIVEQYLMFINGGKFGIEDPLFALDIGYYVFKRPFIMSVFSSFYSIWIIISLFVFGVYFSFMTVFASYKVTDFLKIKSIGFHNVFNLTVVIILKALQYKFVAEDLLFGSFGELSGAGYTDKIIWLNYYRVIPFVLIIITAFVLYFFRKNKYKNILKSIIIFPALWILTGIFAFVFQTIFVSPNEVVREQASISDNIKYTKLAYNIENTKEIEFDIQNNLSAEDLEKNKDTLDSIRIIDINSNLTVLNQIQGIRNYYKFNETDIIPYVINGEKTAVAITPREITKENLTDTSDTYINRTLRYTHGFGAVINPINGVSPQGHPEFLIKDIPPKSVEGIDKITQPRIYFGELTNDYVIVGSKKYKELDYSEGQEDIEFTYDGTAGINLSIFNRLLFASKYGDFRILVSNMYSSESKILINRNITERLKVVAPFFEYDTDPYIIIDADGKLKWIVDAYTTTKFFPYSQYTGNINYIRNSVKAVIDAYNGNVKFYISDANDPIVKAYASAYPELFETKELPDDIKEHIKYPELLFSVQAGIYSMYHIDNPTAFYNKNDMWVIAREKYGTSADEEKNILPYYNLMKLDGESENELLLTIPYTLANKDNMVAQLAVRNEWDNYGQLYVYKYPKDINVYGPMQIENRINSDTEISSALTLWSQGGSKVIRGNMMIVPINNSILYIEPLYMMSNNQSALPELKQVIVAYNEKIIMKNTLSEALYALFDKSVPESFKTDISFEQDDTLKEEAEEGITYETAARAVIENFKAVKEASGNGDWNDFGRYMSELENAVKDLEKQTNLQNNTSPQ